MTATKNTCPRGWVYIVVNDLCHSRFKIGMTDRDPIERAKEFIATGTTGTFVVLYHALVDNPYEVEQQVHRKLWQYNKEREWFEVCPNLAVQEIRAVAGAGLYLEVTEPRWHRSQPEPSDTTKELLREARERAEAQRAEQARLEAEAERERLRREEEARAEHRRGEEERTRAQRQRDWEEASRRQQQEQEQAESQERERLETEHRQQLEAERLRRVREERDRWTRLLVDQARRLVKLAVPVVVVLLGLWLIGGLLRLKPTKQADPDGKHGTDAEKETRATPPQDGGHSPDAQVPEVLRGDYNSRMVKALSLARAQYEAGYPQVAIRSIWPFCEANVAEHLYGEHLLPWRQLLAVASDCCSVLGKNAANTGDIREALSWRLKEGYCAHTLAREHMMSGESSEAWNAFDSASDIYERVAAEGLRYKDISRTRRAAINVVVFALRNNAEMRVQFAEDNRLPERKESSTTRQSLAQQARSLASECLALRDKFLPQDIEGRGNVAEILRKAESLP